MPSENPIIVLSASGHRGAIAMMTLQMMGYEDVQNLLKGADGIPAD